ncbi:MAG: hypothetical protein M1376_03880 [Planctomycetes bacterium]|nr:hypothetical protein [Planctomycetota bacterium]
MPPNLLLLEADPLKSSSDPGYYGREYAFQGDVVVENGYLTAVVRSAKGKVVVSSKNAKFEIGDSRFKSISRCIVLQNTGDDVALEVSFSTGAKGGDTSAVLAFGKTPIVEIKPAPTMKGISLRSTIEYGVLPGFVGDDLVVAPGQYPSDSVLDVPCESLFLGLLKGETSVLVMTWPKGKQQMKLGLSRQGQEGRLIESIAFDNDGQSLYVSLLEAPGIWHKEPLGVSYLEKDVASKWKRPFPAKWVTQLWEGEVRTTYTFRAAPAGTIWRGVAGMYNYPLWFNGDAAWFRLGKKVLPKGESIIYFLEGKDTPASVLTPVDIMKATLGRPMCDSILDLAGQKLRTHHRRGAIGIRRACTCGCTEAIEAVFKAGQEIEKKEYIEGAVGDMVYFVTRHVERLNEYRAFADDMTEFLRTTASSQPELKTYLESLTQIVQRIGELYETQKENIKSLEYAAELSRKTLALLQKKDPKNLSTCLDLGKDWRGMGGAQDGVLAEYHIIVRKLFQEAGYGCLNQPKAVDVAREIRRRCRQCLRNPDGYEIWPNY